MGTIFATPESNAGRSIVPPTSRRTPTVPHPRSEPHGPGRLAPRPDRVPHPTPGAVTRGPPWRGHQTETATHTIIRGLNIPSRVA
jgi:hypothetical protein